MNPDMQAYLNAPGRSTILAKDIESRSKANPQQAYRQYAAQEALGLQKGAPVTSEKDYQRMMSQYNAMQQDDLRQAKEYDLIRQAAAQENSDFKALGESNFYNKMAPTYDLQAKQNAKNKLQSDLSYETGMQGTREANAVGMANALADNLNKRLQRDQEAKAAGQKAYNAAMGYNSNNLPTTVTTTNIAGTGSLGSSYLPGQYSN
jgi:hypothetical protein